MLDADPSKSSKLLRHDIAQLERINGDIDSFISKRTNPEVFGANLLMMKRKMRIRKLADHIFGVSILPLFIFVFVEQAGKVKLIAISDTV